MFANRRIKHGEGQGARRRGRRPHAALLLALALVAMQGCKQETPIGLIAPTEQRPLTLAELKTFVMKDSLLWQTLDAQCTVTIADQSIQLPGNQVTFTEGRLAIQKPGMVNLTCPATSRPAIKLVGDGEAYRVMMPAFRSMDYSGRYGDPIPSPTAGIRIMPEDVADALDLTNLFYGKAQTLMYETPFAFIYSLSLVPDPLQPDKPTMAVASRIRVESGSNRIITYDKCYTSGLEAAGTIKVTITLGDYQLVKAGGGATVSLPNSIRLDYGATGTAIRLTLSDIRLNTTLEPALFKVAGS
jgi:hypothetical protein